MKIVDLKEFMELPEGVVFTKYTPCVFDELCIKGSNVGEFDFLINICTRTLSGINNYSPEVLEMNKSIPMDFDSVERDGCFDEGQLFAVYEKADVEGLIAKLQKSLKAY